MNEINITKADGSLEPFSEEKVRNSIKRAGISEQMVEPVLAHVKSKLYDGIESWIIYQHIVEFLGKSDKPYLKSKYSLKQSIMMLGPTGYPFEDFIGRILQSLDYKTSVRQIIKGKCINHEIDVIAEKENEKLMVEAKFHNNPGIRSDLHVAMYTLARYLDIKVKNDFTKGFLITNTKVTSDAISYSDCEGLSVMGWSYPDGNSLRDIIERLRLYPITMLQSISNSHKAQLLANHVVLCQDVFKDNKLLNILNLSQKELKIVIDEVNSICS